MQQRNRAADPALVSWLAGRAITWKDGAAVREYANGLAAPGIRKVLDEHYLKHPLASFRGSEDPAAVFPPLPDEENKSVSDTAGTSAA
jgi:hypothetical protein